MIRGSRIPHQIEMDFAAPMMVDGELKSAIFEEDVQSEIVFWKAGLLAVGEDLTMNTIKQFMTKV